MFFNGNAFWLINGILLVLIVFAVNYFAEDRGWIMSWWKWLLMGIWYLIFSTSFYAWGTLIGENFPGAGFWTLLSGLFVSVILGVGLWRLLGINPKSN